MLTPHFTSWIRRLLHTAAPSGKRPLQLEMLEDRTTPSVAANDLFVSSLYQVLLGRPADVYGVAYWSNLLNVGISRQRVAQGIATSNEALSRDVQLFYQTELNRPADAAGLAYWMAQLKTGATLDQVKAGIVGSNEFFTDAGSTDSSFVESLYRHELGRPADAAGMVYWANQLASGQSRAAVAGRILASTEAAREKTTSFYTDVFDRLPDANGLNYWSAQLEGGVPETTVLAGLLGSNEYYNRVQNAAAMTPWSDPNAAAADMIGAAGLFTGPLPGAEYLAHRLLVVPPPAPQAVSPPAVATAPTPAISPTTTDSSNTPAVPASDSSANQLDTSAPSIDPGEYNAWAEAASNGVPPPASFATDPAWTDSGAYTTLLEIFANSQQNTWYASDPYAPGNINNIDPSA